MVSSVRRGLSQEGAGFCCCCCHCCCYCLLLLLLLSAVAVVVIVAAAVCCCCCCCHCCCYCLLLLLLLSLLLLKKVGMSVAVWRGLSHEVATVFPSRWNVFCVSLGNAWWRMMEWVRFLSNAWWRMTDWVRLFSNARWWNVPVLMTLPWRDDGFLSMVMNSSDVVMDFSRWWRLFFDVVREGGGILWAPAPWCCSMTIVLALYWHCVVVLPRYVYS